MATEKVGVYKKWHGAVPTDDDGKPLPKDEWPRKRPFRWAVRWFGSDEGRSSKVLVPRPAEELLRQSRGRYSAARRAGVARSCGHSHDAEALCAGARRAD